MMPNYANNDRPEFVWNESNQPNWLACALQDKPEGDYYQCCSMCGLKQEDGSGAMIYDLFRYRDENKWHTLCESCVEEAMTHDTLHCPTGWWWYSMADGVPPPNFVMAVGNGNGGLEDPNYNNNNDEDPNNNDEDPN